MGKKISNTISKSKKNYAKVLKVKEEFAHVFFKWMTENIKSLSYLYFTGNN